MRYDPLNQRVQPGSDSRVFLTQAELARRWRIGALLARATDTQGEVQAVQLIYLTETGRKVSAATRPAFRLEQ